MNIAYIDFNSCSFFEDYALDNFGYGGGSVVARWGKILLNNKKDNFFIFAPEECFRNVKESNDRKDRCIPIPKEYLLAMRNGYAIDNFIDLSRFDIILYHNTCEHHINKGRLKIPLCCWSLSGLASGVGYTTDYALLYNKKEIIPAFPHQKIKHIQIGKQVPKRFEERKKENYIVQISQHSKDFNSIEVAKLCIENKIQCYFAGPIVDNYGLKEYIDSKYTFYLGEISETDKLKLYEKSRLLILLNKNEVPFNQSVIEANGLGVPVLVSHIGWYKEYVEDGKNGFFYNGNNFLECYNNTTKINQNDCYLAAKKYDVDKMIDSIYLKLKEAINET